MEKREFFLRRPFLQFAPAIGIIALLYIPFIAQLARGGSIVPVIATDSDDFAAGFWSSFPASFALSGAVMTTFVLILLAFAAYTATRRPFLVLDAESLQANGLKLTWASIGDVTTGRNFGTPCLRIASSNNNALVARLRFPLNLIFGLRVRLYGAPIFVPPINEITLDELRELIERYKSAADS